MNQLIQQINHLKTTPIAQQIKQRINQFKQINHNNDIQLFNELCYCILAANYDAEKTINIQQTLNNTFHLKTKQQLTKKLKQLGYRFPNIRAEYITCSAQKRQNLPQFLKEHTDENCLRNTIQKNIKGLGIKESSHFLRNIGYDNYAIIDFHILDILEQHNLITKPKSLTTKKYLEIEQQLQQLAQQTNLTLAELDLYLWYLETGKILK